MGEWESGGVGARDKRRPTQETAHCCGKLISGVVTMSVREPAVAGMFYRAVDLREELKSCFLDPRGPGRLPTASPDGPRRVIGLVSPHAGFVYSGPIAAHAYLRMAEDGLPKMAVIIGPNHRSYVPPAALSDDDSWRTPLGDVPLDRETAREIASAYSGATCDRAAHRLEHSLEVQLPFLQYVMESAGGLRIGIVPILIGASARTTEGGGEAEFARKLGAAIAGALADTNAVIIASTDFTHYESSRSAAAKDSRAMAAILALDEAALLREVQALDISMCGALPTAIMIAACKALGAVSAEQLAYADSGDVTGDHTEVVGYGALAVLR